MLDGNVPEMHTQFLLEQNILYRNTTDNAIQKPDNGPALGGGGGGGGRYPTRIFRNGIRGIKQLIFA